MTQDEFYARPVVLQTRESLIRLLELARKYEDGRAERLLDRVLDAWDEFEYHVGTADDE